MEKNQLYNQNGAQTNIRQKRLKRLKKVHIWPSILFFLLSLIITITSVVTLVGLFISYIFQQKFDMDLQATKYIGSIIENGLSKGQSYKQAMEFLDEDSYFDNSVAILDKNKVLIACKGTASYDLERTGNLELWDSNQFYMDEESTGDIFDEEGHMMLDLNQLIGRCFVDLGEDSDDWVNQEIYHEPYWIVMPDNAFEHQILVRNNFCLYRKDIIFICGVGAAILFVMFIPLLFLFIHVLSSILMQRRMYKVISMDPVTGGYNWFYYKNHAEKRMNSFRTGDKTYAVIHFSYRKYRSYCTCHGVGDGEVLLQQMDQFLTGCMKKGELCAHNSEAEFALLIRCESREEAENRIKVWFNDIASIIPQCHMASSAGICMVDALNRIGKFKRPGRRKVDVTQLYHNAGVAEDAILETEERHIRFFDDAMRAEQLWEHHVEENMEGALEKEEFQVYFQPKYDPITEELAGAEALVRWINEEDGFVSPGKFIPIFENNGFITTLDDYMISATARLQKKWLEEGKKVVPVSVNVSRAHFTSPDLAEHICKLVDQYQLPHKLLEIELTESAFFDDKTALLQTVNALQTYGFLVSMDDFGSGYSSLNSLKELPLDVLKLDAEFFRGKYERERGEIVVSEAIQLAKSLNMKIVAEGIEKKEQVDFLAKLGCDMIQGFYFAKPMPAEEYGMKM